MDKPQYFHLEFDIFYQNFKTRWSAVSRIHVQWIVRLQSAENNLIMNINSVSFMLMKVCCVLHSLLRPTHKFPFSDARSDCRWWKWHLPGWHLINCHQTCHCVRDGGGGWNIQSVLLCVLWQKNVYCLHSLRYIYSLSVREKSRDKLLICIKWKAPFNPFSQWMFD